MATLLLKSGANAGREFPLGQGLNRVGRAPGNEIAFDEATLSVVHCELWLMEERLLVRDLGSTNGTFINGRLVSEAELSEGDLLGLGAVEFLVQGLPGRVAIPKSIPAPPPPRFLPDGTPCCVNHALAQADYRCVKCGEQFCSECVRMLGRRGGAQHAYCPICNGECLRIALPPRASGTDAESKGWLTRLAKTLRLKT